MIRWRVFLLVVAWTVCAAVGTASMIRYEFTPGARCLAPSDWPVSTQIRPDGSRPTLLLFLHPQCPCSRATLAEMQRLIADCSEQFALHILLVRPPRAPADWEQTELYRAAAQMPAAHVQCDLGGAEAAHFGALTSGEILLYASNGRLLYHAVFDALSTKRCYKAAFPLEKCFAILMEGRGTHFDPEVLDAFFAAREEIVAVQISYAEVE